MSVINTVNNSLEGAGALSRVQTAKKLEKRLENWLPVALMLIAAAGLAVSVGAFGLATNGFVDAAIAVYAVNIVAVAIVAASVCNNAVETSDMIERLKEDRPLGTEMTTMGESS